MGYVIGLLGMWLFAESLFSLAVYLPRAEQKLIPDHAIRILRGVLGIVLMIFGRLL